MKKHFSMLTSCLPFLSLTSNILWSAIWTQLRVTVYQRGQGISAYRFTVHRLQSLKRGIQIGEFCKQFNYITENLKPGIPLPTEIRLNPDRTLTIKHRKPTTTYFLTMAAGAKRGAKKPGQEIAGKVTLRHIYEIAKIKKEDEPLRLLPMKAVCKTIIGVAHSIGIEVVKDLDPKEYQQFLTEREEVMRQQDMAAEEEKQSRLLRI